MQSIRELASEIIPKGAQLILYGSQARGDAREDSDWDLLVLIDKDKAEASDYDELVYPFTSLGWSLGEMIIPVLYTQKEWQASSVTPFYKNIEKEGVRLI
ncbi:MAG: nucleotidyltransferase domain-containing protein [Bacteroidales bacterium]|nr:nucleotidyltransferase domain-containing protein [Bacteroidales bacterium]